MNTVPEPDFFSWDFRGIHDQSLVRVLGLLDGLYIDAWWRTSPRAVVSVDPMSSWDLLQNALERQP